MCEVIEAPATLLAHERCVADVWLWPGRLGSCMDCLHKTRAGSSLMTWVSARFVLMSMAEHLLPPSSCCTCLLTHRAMF